MDKPRKPGRGRRPIKPDYNSSTLLTEQIELAVQLYPRKRTIYYTLAELFDVDVNYLLTENEEFMTQVGEQYGRRGQVQVEKILSQTKELFAGGTLSEADQIAFLTEMQQIFLDSKKRTKEKYTPKKYRKTKAEEGGDSQR